MANSTQELIDSLNGMLSGMGRKPIPSIDEIKAQNAARNARAKSANERMDQNAIGKEIRVKLGSNEFLRGTIVEAEQDTGKV